MVSSLIKPPPGTVSNPYSPAIRLLLIPFLVYLAWLLEIFLLAGNNRLLEHPEPAGIALYTIIGCVLTGIIIPILCIRKAFISGDVNMFQIGFRTLHRTVLACSLTSAIIFAMVLFFNPFGTDRMAFANAFLLLLPTSLAMVMICWVLTGTHVQAFVRSGGAVLSVTVGLVVTSLLFASASLVINPLLRQESGLFWPVCIGIGSALFFFAVRDVYATVLVVASSTVFTGSGMFDPAYLHGSSPGIYLSSLLALVVLISIHFSLSRHYATILVPAGR